MCKSPHCHWPLLIWDITFLKCTEDYPNLWLENMDSDVFKGLNTFLFLCGVTKIISIWLTVSLKQWWPQKIAFRFLLHFALPFTGTQNTAANIFLQLLPIPPTLYTTHIYFHVILEAQNNHTVFKGITVPTPNPRRCWDSSHVSLEFPFVFWFRFVK